MYLIIYAEDYGDYETRHFEVMDLEAAKAWVANVEAARYLWKNQRQYAERDLIYMPSTSVEAIFKVSEEISMEDFVSREEISEAASLLLKRRADAYKIDMERQREDLEKQEREMLKRLLKKYGEDLLLEVEAKESTWDRSKLR